MAPRGINAVRQAALEKGENVQAAVALWKPERKAKAERERAAKRADGGLPHKDVDVPISSSDKSQALHNNKNSQMTLFLLTFWIYRKD